MAGSLRAQSETAAVPFPCVPGTALHGMVCTGILFVCLFVCFLLCICVLVVVYVNVCMRIEVKGQLLGTGFSTLLWVPGF